MVAHQAVGEQAKGIAQACLCQGFEKGMVVVGPAKDSGPIITAVERVVNQAISHQTRLPSHGPRIGRCSVAGKRKYELL